MKKILVIGASIILTATTSCCYGQLWKHYADSATLASSQQNQHKAIDQYNKAVEILKADSAETRTYASILDSVGNLLYVTRKYAPAEKQILTAKQIQEKILGKENLDYAYSCSVLGNIYKDQGQNPKAIPLLQETKQLRERILGKEHNSYANACYNLGTAYAQTGQWSIAIPLWQETKRVREKLFGKNIEYATACNSLAFAYNLVAQDSLAEELFMEALGIREKYLGKDHTDYATSCIGIGGLYIMRKQYEKAEPWFITAREIRGKQYGKEHPDYAVSCFSLGLVYMSWGKYSQAKPFFIEAREIQKQIAGTQNYLYSYYCNNVANIYKNMGEYELAEPLYLEAKQIIDKVGPLGNPGYFATICNDFADFYRILGRYDQAEKLFLQSKPIFERMGKNNVDYATACDNLGHLYLQIGQYDKAEKLYQESMQIRKSFLGKQPIYYVFSCNNLADVYISNGEYEKAMALLQEAKELVKDSVTCSFIFITLGNVYASMQQFDNASEFFLKGIKILEKAYGKENRDYIAALNGLGSAYYSGRQYQKAITLLETVTMLQERSLGKQHPDYRVTCNNLGELYWAIHKPLEAEKNFSNSFTASVDNLENVFRFTNEKEKTAFIKNNSGEDDKAYSFYISQKLRSGLPYSMSLFHRNLILSSSKALKNELLSSGDTGLINKYNEWISLKKYLSVLYAVPVKERKEDFRNLEEKAGELEKQLARLSPGFQKEQQRPDWKNIKLQLKPGEAAVEFIAFRLYNGTRYTDSIAYAALVLKKESNLPSIHYLFTENKLSDLLSPLKNTSGNAVTDLYAARGIIKGNKIAVSRSLSDLIWKPIEKELAGVKTVYFAPAGLLHRVSFAALPVNNTQLLSDRYKLVQLNSTASVAEVISDRLNRFDKIMLYGGINYDADSTSLQQVAINYKKAGNTRSLPADLNTGNAWSKLEGTQLEINEINKSGASDYIINVLSGVEANEESVKALDGKASPDVIHIASHGFFFPDPKQHNPDKTKQPEASGKIFKQSDDPLFRSGLLFAGANNTWQGKPVDGIEDGILTAYEVSNMYLPNTKLVVLSACETALGDIHGSEGVYGLQRAFKIAGAQNLVMSLWKVPDAETAEFMRLFYKNMFAKESIGDAFYQAQTAMKNRYRNDPYKWAAWVLIR